MTGTCWQQLQYITLLHAWKNRLDGKEEQVEKPNEMDLECVAQLDELPRYFNFSPQVQDLTLIFTKPLVSRYNFP
ncbi:uncharacterized protein Bfra_010566 [Botrytis fragariae]|uniref:Uncharacterized protein n=1 Tax=Botrytis fragariae TaxID=1964551 RepID=A0A8H6AHT0_9HELO|nr:uncharacterized protein Bfra_010566 [Botrytis fragariae]KAF5867591.1 hypothetical protein Bfra_010566 [Botrytis fragariae]